MKILYVMRNIWGGGAPTRFWEIHNLLAQSGFDITLLATPDASTYQKFDHKRFPDIEIIPLKIQKSSITDYVFYFKASKIVRNIANNFDIIHDDFSPMAPYSFLWKDSTIATVHNIFTNVEALNYYGIVGSALSISESLFKKMGYKVFIAPSFSTAEGLRKLGANSIIIPNGVKTQIFKPNHDPRKQNKIVISMTSRFVPVKGHIHFLNVANKLYKKNNNVKFILPCNGPLLKTIKSQSNKLGLPIQFLGFVSKERIVRILQGSNIYVHTSLNEGFGISICEAMSSGLPVVAFDTNGARDLVTPECGFIVPLGDVDEMTAKIELLIEDESLRIDMGKKARDIVLRHFSWQKSAEKMIKVYNKIY